MAVAVVDDLTPVYPPAPFSPGAIYPEYPFKPDSAGTVISSPYSGIRECLKLLHLDEYRYGTRSWNPFSELIKPDNTVVIKPNFVIHYHPSGNDLFSITTHPSVIRAVCDYVFIALQGSGRIVIADAPQMDCNISELLQHSQLHAIQAFYAEQVHFKIEFVDLRSFWTDADKRNSEVTSTSRHPLPGDPLGSALINLGSGSEYFELARENRYFGADYDRKITNAHHHGHRHEYSISKTVLSSDVFISVPKFKVHKKVGVTLNIKGLVGIATDKNFLIHYTRGTPENGGDETPDFRGTRRKIFSAFSHYLTDNLMSRNLIVLERLYIILNRFQKRCLASLGFGLGPAEHSLYGGNWHGNDSAWRMAVDLAKIIYYADKSGQMRPDPARRFFSVIDGIVGGEGDGPLNPAPKKAGMIIAGDNLVACDCVGARLMGFSPLKIPTIVNLLRNEKGFDFKVSFDDIAVQARKESLSQCLEDTAQAFCNFKEPPGWGGRLQV